MSNGFDRVRTIIQLGPETFDEAVALAIKAARETGTVAHVRFDTQITANNNVVYIAFIMIRDRKPRPEQSDGHSPSTRDGQEGA